MTKILLVEDEEKIARFVQLELEHEGYAVELAADGRTGADRAVSGEFDLVLLDVLLPQLNGMEVLRRIRREGTTPVIMLTARDAVMDKVAGLDAGADDYITKPFVIEELLARVRVALKRHELAWEMQGARAGSGEGSLIAAVEPETPVLEVNGVTLDVDRHEVTVAGEPVELTNREFEILRALMAHEGRVMSRAALAHEALGYEFVGETNVIDVHIARLRAKLDDRFGIKLITTVRGVGYAVK
ncbi:response regulator transcription factor [Collinsella provencensis]|uniref:response regulator transcription factor n=1 Tax=Collinsella provencensis TaxID=1937461 RepID=UPI000C8278E0|nr:response regulator transcription factor [Collinsella provencensis]